MSGTLRKRVKSLTAVKSPIMEGYYILCKFSIEGWSRWSTEQSSLLCTRLVSSPTNVFVLNYSFEVSQVSLIYSLQDVPKH